MEYFETWNIPENGIFLNIEYLASGKWQRKTKHYVINHKPIFHILEHRKFQNMEYFQNGIF